MDPRTALLSCLVYSLVVALRSRFLIWDLVPLMLVVSLSGLRNGGELSRSITRIIKLNGFVLFVALGIYMFHKDVRLAELILIRSNLIISFNIFVLSGLSTFEVYEGLASLPMPRKVKLLSLYLIKFIEILQREYARLQEALEARGFRPRTDLFTYKSYAFMIGNMLAKSMKRSRDMYDAMVARGFTGDVYPIRERGVELTDILVALSILIQTIMVVILEVSR